jgi:hypothetical protein
VARIRTIKPEFWVDEKVVECSAFARLLFIGLWNFADDDGRMEYREKKIKMQIFPSDTLDISELIGELRRENLIEVYTVDNKQYLQICGFCKHQKVDKRSASKHPSPPDPADFPRVPPTEGIKEGKGKDTLPNGKDAPASDEKKGAFDLAVSYLTNYGKSEQQTRTLVGKWLRDGNTGYRIENAIRSAQVAATPDPVPYIERILRGPGKALSESDGNQIDKIFQEAGA